MNGYGKYPTSYVLIFGWGSVAVAVIASLISLSFRGSTAPWTLRRQSLRFSLTTPMTPLRPKEAPSDRSAIALMILTILLVWGGLVASVVLLQVLSVPSDEETKAAQEAIEVQLALRDQKERYEAYRI